MAFGVQHQTVVSWAVHRPFLLAYEVVTTQVSVLTTPGITLTLS